MKIYEAETLTAATKSRAKQYEELKKEVTALKKEFQGIVGLDNEFQGAGATAIKSFYEAQIEVADAWMELFTTQISFLEGIPASLEEADLSGNTVVEVPFLDGEVSNGINQAKSLVDQQANDLQRILNSIDDILTLDMFDQKDFNEKITLAGHRLDDTVTKVENVDRQLVEEYDVSIGQENVAVGLFRALLDATKQDGHVSPMTFNQSAFKSSDVYQVKDEVAGQMKDYQTFKKEQAEARKIEQEMEELENRPWYEKAWDTTKTFTGEFTGYYDSIRASTGVDPVTGRKLSDAERIAAGAMAAAGFIPVVGWAGRAIKGGSAIYKTAKGLNAADHALDAYKTTKGFSLLQKTEYGIYGLLAANGLGEAVTGKDMFGNQLTEEQRQNGLLMALGIGGVAGAAKVADKVASGTKFVPYSKEFAQKQVQKVQAFSREIGKVEVPLRIRVEELATAYGNNYKHVTFDKTTIKDIVQKFAVKSDGGKGTGNISNNNVSLNRIDYLHDKYGRFTSEDLNHRINLRGALAQEVERLNKLGISKREMGPAIAGTFDKTTGKYYFGINNTTGKIPEKLHSLIEQRIINMPKDIKEGYTFTYGAGSHAEVYSLNQALLANPQASSSNFITHVVRSGKKLKPAGMMMPTCPHCNYITEGFEFSSEVKKIERSN
ncbi:T7SS effector LXG polymorphic toxin [Peribacillus frigoritolerans]|uniref:T7SS effector LXG polymorphic toxin n=1 Tax=Peribacillus frigoritolerans TaxID=450367 RepID=UPI00207A6414|nr:T7SS effector LXG polymorphic toxin [Peribacillus frigoritolerans]USK80884.1 pre-toxin TG domain-containing protein [Peribacillus frigoritolerans]WJE48158.1 T7SS effector LXG polymorphic toxin [Peribacillus frigoritolerans]